MEGETKVSVKLEAKDEVLLLPRTTASGYTAMESEATICVKPEATDEMCNVSKTNVTELKPACLLCSRVGPDGAAIFPLEPNASDIGAEALVPIVHIKKEPEDTSDQKTVTNLLATHEVCGRTKEEEQEMIARLIAEADKNGTDLLLSNKTVKKELEDTKDQQVIEDLLGFCRLCDIEDKELALALQPVYSNVEKLTQPISGNNRRSLRSAVKKCSDVGGGATAHRDQKSSTVEATLCATGDSPSRALDTDWSGGGEESTWDGYTCSSCASSFSSKYRLVRHVFTHMIGVQPPSHVCRLCGDVFSSGRGLRRHLFAGGVGGGVAGTDDRRERTSRRRTSLGRRSGCAAERAAGEVRSETSLLAPSVGNSLQTENSRQKYRSDNCGNSRLYTFEPRVLQNLLTSERPHTCCICHRSFTSSSDLRRHEVIHSQDKPFKCVDCGKCFKRSDHLRKHAVMHSENEPYTCDKCGKSFKRYGTLQMHALVHTDERSYTCGDCGKTFKSRGSLLVHTRSHIGQKSHVCDICGASYTRQDSLRVHRRMHFGERPFECKVCGATFGRASTRREHVRIHTGEKPYECGICGATFAYSSLYSKHKQLSSTEIPAKCPNCISISDLDNLLEQLGVVRAEKSSHQCVDCGVSFIRHFRFKVPLECGYCGKMFCLITAIRKHALIHSIKRSFVCVSCGNTYKRRDSLKRHQKDGSCKSNHCGKSFSRIDISKKKSYECVDCGNIYLRPDSLNRHQMTRSCKSNRSDEASSRVDVVKGRRKICTVNI